MKRTTFRKKSTAKKHRGAGRRVYKTKAGWHVSPECPRAGARRRELIKQRTKTRKANRPKKVKGVRLTVVWPDDVAPF